MSENDLKEFNIFEIPEEYGFLPINPNIKSKILSDNREINPIIHEMFQRLISGCANNYDFQDLEDSFDDYLQFYKEAARIFQKREKKVIQIEGKTKVYFVGDLHGAIQETFLLVDYFYEKIIQDPQIKVAFVGDYVDRNPFDLETLTLVVGFHLLFPNNVVLLRGNHETREINEDYGFYDNLLREFRDEADIIYQEILKIYKKLPIMVLVQIYSTDSRIARVLVVHGGIPIHFENPEEPVLINALEEKIDCEYEKTNEMDEYTISILWSDPDEMANGIITGPHLHGRTKFGNNIFNNFIQANNLDLVVRGHQKWNSGYHIFFGKMYSLFSTSTYDGKKRFNPVFLCLEYGKEPQFIPITQEYLN